MNRIPHYPNNCIKCNRPTDNRYGYCPNCRRKDCKDCGKQFVGLRIVDTRCSMCRVKHKYLLRKNKNSYGF